MGCQGVHRTRKFLPRAADVHAQVADARLAEAAGIVDHPAAPDTTGDRREAHAPTAARLAGRHEDLDLVEGEGQAAQSLEQPTARRSGRGGGLSPPLVVGPPLSGLTQAEARQDRVEQPHVCDRVALLPAAIIAPLLRRILGAPDAPFRAIMPHRGEAGTWAAAGVGGADGCGGSGTGTTSALASVSVIPRRCARAAPARVRIPPGAPPRL